MKPVKKKILAYIGIVLAFLVISYGFVPEVLGGKIVNQSDITGYVGMAHEANEWNSAHPGDRTAWTGSMFGGMPTTMLTGNSSGDATQSIFDFFLIGRRPASYLFISLLGAFLLMLALGVHPFLGAAGAVAVTFCSYNLQIIQVGHNAKMLALAWAPWVLAAVIYSYRKALGAYGEKAPSGKLSKWADLLAGPVLTGLALGFQIKANHVQISYYLSLIIISYVLVTLVWVLRKQKDRLKKFLTTSALLIVFAGIGIATNANRLLPTWEYTQETMRGGSELSQDGGSKSKGLNFEYATQWSYGLEELPNLMIPNYNGGSSAGAVKPEKSATIKLLKSFGQTNTREIAKALPMYWGPQPFTAGPMYIGAITIFLFVLGLCLPKGNARWWVLIPSILGILLAFGGAYGRTDLLSSIFRGFNRFWFDNMPFYNKFRTVSMALVILQFTMPVLAFLALDRALKANQDKKVILRATTIAFAVTGGFCLLCWLFPGIAGSFTSAGDSGYDPRLAAAFTEDRISLMRSDALVSLLLILASAALIFWMYKPKSESRRDNRSILAGAGICLLLCLNLFLVGKRYLNSSHFVTQSKFDSHFTERPVDKFILADDDLSYRVVDLTTDVFNDATPSYWHKNIGGYSPVKLQRFQDLIDNYLRGELSSAVRAVGGASTVQEAQDSLDAAAVMPLLSALNGRYIIVDGSAPALVNKSALGNAWFVDTCVVAATPDEEIALVGAVDLASTAVLGKEISPLASLGRKDKESLGRKDKESLGRNDNKIELTSYAPNQLEYSYKAGQDALAVFSEIWCNYGWKAWLEDASGNKTADIELLKADWTLRAAVLPAGEHKLVMRFEPASYAKGRRISAISSWLLILLALGCALAPKVLKNN
ncbi:MAG: hypothetical protein SPL35_07405 [Bacteroidales bacterium]|nr:hypothetical protein [Bacteroidales bacterium]